MRNLQEEVRKAFCHQKLSWIFTVWVNCSCDLKIFANSRPSALNFKSFSWSIEQFFLAVGKNNFGNKIPFFSIFSLGRANVDDWKVTYLWNLRPNVYYSCQKFCQIFGRLFLPPCRLCSLFLCLVSKLPEF